MRGNSRDSHSGRRGLTVVAMDNGNEVRDFLVSRRARITPAQAGVVNDGSLRRVPGLRRREVAVLAGVSIEYYTRLERGNLSGVSDSVLEAVGRALHLDEAERAHLFDLARAQGPAPQASHAPPAADPPRGAGHPGRVHRWPCVRPQRPAGCVGHQPVGPRRLRRDVPGPAAAAEPGPVRVSGRPVAPVLPGLGPRRERHGRHSADRGRPRPLRRRPDRAGRDAVDHGRRSFGSGGPRTT